MELTALQAAAAGLRMRTAMWTDTATVQKNLPLGREAFRRQLSRRNVLLLLYSVELDSTQRTMFDMWIAGRGLVQTSGPAVTPSCGRGPECRKTALHKSEMMYCFSQTVSFVLNSGLGEGNF